MKGLQFLIIVSLMLACQKQVSPPIAVNESPSFSESIPDALIGGWVRTGRLQTFDYQPNALLNENTGTTNQKMLHFNNNFTYQSNQIDCSTCKTAYLKDTLFLVHSKGIYKFRALAITDSALHLQTNIGIPRFSLPNTGLFDFVLEEQYKKIR